MNFKMTRRQCYTDYNSQLIGLVSDKLLSRRTHHVTSSGMKCMTSLHTTS